MSYWVNKMQILPPLLTQAGQLARLEASQPLAAGWGEDGFKGEIPLACAVILTAQEGREPIGFICARRAADTAEIVNLAVHPHYTRQGIGGKLLQAVLQRLRALGVTSVTLEVNEVNAPAVGLYTRAGFSVWNRRKAFYGRQDALLMGIKL